MSIRGTKYIIRHGDLFQLRLPIPKDLQDKLRRKELRRSLKTGDAPTAKRRAFRATLLFMELCDSVRLMQDVSAAKAHEIIAAFYTLLVQAYTPPASWKKEPFDHFLNDQISAADNYAVDFAQRVKNKEQTKTDLTRARDLLAKFGMDFDKLPTERQEQIWQGMYRAYSENVRFLEFALSASTDGYAATDEMFKHIDGLQLIAPASPLAKPIIQSSKPMAGGEGGSLKTLATIFLESGKEQGISTSGAWGKTTASVYDRILKWFGEHAGPATDVRLIDQKVCRDFRDRLMKVKMGSSIAKSFDAVQTPDVPLKR